MDDFLKQIELAQNANLFYLSLFCSLSVPDICGALDATDGRATASRYRSWYQDHVVPRYDTLSADEAYLFRCSSLHQGSSEPDRPRDYERVVFIEPAQLSINVRRMEASGRIAIMIDLKRLIPAIVAAARSFCAERSGSEPFDSNIKAFMRRHPKGFPPWVMGAPTIA